MPDTTQVSPTRQCFTIFEGGGAKGITHLGALRALEDVGLARIGTAGTSAGAIIAALTAVGYAADELFTSGADNILARAGRTPVDLLGLDDWLAFVALRPAPYALAIDAGFRRARRALMTLALVLIPPVLPLVSFALSRLAGRPKLLAAAWRIIDDFGFFSTTPARDILNDLLCQKLGLPAGTLVCFRDVAPEAYPACCRLKIITTNLVHAGLQLFDHTTPGVVVADAVAASFSIPIFFKPTRIRCVEEDGRHSELPDIYADGGLVSNLPVWVFFEDKKAVERADENRNGRPLPIVAFQLVATGRAAASQRASPVAALLRYVAGVLHTGVFGGQSIVENFTTHLTIVELPTGLDVVQFDCTGAEALAAYESGRTAAAAKLTTVFRENPAHRSDILAGLVRDVDARSAVLRAGASAGFRACVVRRLGNLSFKVIASIGMDGDTDDDLVLDQNNPAAPTAYRDRDMTYVDLTEPFADLRMTKYERALVRRTLAGVISVPIFESTDDWLRRPEVRPEPRGIMCVDSDTPLHLEYSDPSFLRLLSERAVELAPYMVFEKETS